MNERWRCLLQLGTQSTEKGTVENWSYLHNVTAREFNRFVSVLNIASVCHRRGKRCQLFSFSSKWFGNFKKSFIDKRLVNPVKYHYLSLRLLRSLFEKFENKCKNKHEVQIKLSKVQTCTTDLASYSLTQWQFWQLTLKWNGFLKRALRIRPNNIIAVIFFSYFHSIIRFTENSLPDSWIPR